MQPLTLNVVAPSDRLLLAGLAHVQRVVDELERGVLIIGGLATTAWLRVSPVELPVRTTRDVDLGIDRIALGLTDGTNRIRPVLTRHHFVHELEDEPFRFTCETEAGAFLLDLLLPKGASRREPPLIEAGLDSLAVPGLAYAIDRGPELLQLTLVADGVDHTFRLPIATLDGMLVMKAALVHDGVRVHEHRRITDTADAVMLALACAHSATAIEALRSHGGQTVRRAIRWLAESFTDERSAAARRVEQHFLNEYGQSGGARWAVEAVNRFHAARTGTTI